MGMCEVPSPPSEVPAKVWGAEMEQELIYIYCMYE